MRRMVLLPGLVLVGCVILASSARCAEFIRGDANSDGIVDIGDAITILSYLFGGGSAPLCSKALDANDSGVIDIADAIYLLAYLFAGGPPPPPPFPDPGPDPTPDDLSCGTIASLVLNEILFDPFGDDAGREWVELYNASAAPVDLSGWRLTDDTGQDIALLPAWEFPPDGYLLILLGEGENDADFSDGRGVFATGAAVEALPNDRGAVGLYMDVPDAETIVDYVCWSRDNTFDPGATHAHAVSAGQWRQGVYLDLGYPNGELLRPGISIGRNARSADTNLPDDWSGSGGRDAFTATPGARNAAPLFTVHDGIKLTQARANLFLVQRGHDVLDASHELIESSQTLSTTFARAHHTLLLGLPDGSTFSLGGEGSYWWHRPAGSSTWQESINLTLHDAVSLQAYTLVTNRSWQSGRIQQAITEDLYAAHETLLYGQATFNGPVAALAEPAVEEGTPPSHLLMAAMTSQTHIGLTRTASDRVMLSGAQHIEDDGLIADITVMKTSTFIDDTRSENRIDTTFSSNVGEPFTVVNRYISRADMDASGSVIATLHNEILEGTVTCGPRECVLAPEGGFFDVAHQDDGRRAVSWMLPLNCGGARTWPLGGAGWIQVSDTGGEQVYSIEMRSDLTGKTARMFIDGAPGQVTGVVSCAVGAGLLGFGAANGWNPAGWIGMGLGVGLGLSSHLQGMAIQGMLAEEGAAVDGAAPRGGMAFTPLPPTPQYGQAAMDVTVTDETCIYRVRYRVTNAQGALIGGRDLISGAGRNSQTTRVTLNVPLRNHGEQPVTWTVRVTAWDNAGNRMPDMGQQVTVSGRSE